MQSSNERRLVGISDFRCGRLSMRLSFLVAVPALMLCLHSRSFSQNTNLPSDADEAFRTGNALMDEKKYCEALLTYKKGLASAPDDTSLLYNGGLAAFQCKQYPAAVELWKHLEGLDAKVAERDQERAELFDLRKNDSSGDIAKRIEYCRDQFEAGGEKIMAFEHFELKGDRAVRYVFSIIDESKHAEKYRLSLGSYDTTNAIWHETTKPPTEGQ
jgi:tetratricopeptide (TPR) repeat protein